MTHDALHFPDPAELARRVSVFPALKRRRQHQSNIWFFDSPKNNERLTISTDLAFMHLVLLEGDASVMRYSPRFNSLGESSDSDIKPAAMIYRHDGALEWWDFKRIRRANISDIRNTRNSTEPSRTELAAQASGATYHVKTDLDLANQEILFDNWLTLCAAITRCRGQFLGVEAEIFSQRMALQHAVTLENLITIPDIDIAHMFAVVALALQRETVRTNLKTQLISRSSLLSRTVG